jgi:hypothetical protein
VRVVRVDGNDGFASPDAGIVEPLQPVESEIAEEAEPEDCRSDYLVRTVGFLVNEGARFLSIAQEILPDGDGFRAVTHIPASIIEAVVTLSAEADLERPAAG